MLVRSAMVIRWLRVACGGVPVLALNADSRMLALSCGWGSDEAPRPWLTVAIHHRLIPCGPGRLPSFTLGDNMQAMGYEKRWCVWITRQ